MTHDNPRFNISGDSEALLCSALRLACEYVIPNQMAQRGFCAYKLDPFLGMVLYWVRPASRPLLPGEIAFPFTEGTNMQALASFIYNYLRSGQAAAILEPPKPAVGTYDQFESMRHDFELDRNADHDGHNERGWRLYSGAWGRLPGHEAPFAVRPIHCWYGK